MICEYGCGKEAKHQFKNGKWCCCEIYKSCSGVRKKMSESQKGRTHSKQTKNKIGSTLDGHKVTIETRRKLSNSNKGQIPWSKGKKLSKLHRQRIGEGRKGKLHSIETKRKFSKYRTREYLSEETIKKYSISHRDSIKDIKEKYLIFSKVEQMRYNPDKPEEKEIQVHCKNHNCPNSKENGGWFTPTSYQITTRKSAIENIDGNEAAYFYCCEECKQECPLYNKRVSQLIKEDQIRAGIIKEEYYTSEEYNIWREEVLKRSNNLCEYCGEKAEHCHHIEPQKLQPYLSLDPENGLACCSKCHYKYGHETGTECSTGNLANRVCI